MKQQRDTLKRYQQRVEKLLEKEKELAKKLLSENKKEYVRNNNCLYTVELEFILKNLFHSYHHYIKNVYFKL